MFACVSPFVSVSDMLLCNNFPQLVTFQDVVLQLQTHERLFIRKGKGFDEELLAFNSLLHFEFVPRLAHMC